MAGFLSKVMPQRPEALGVLTKWLQISPSDYTVRESSYTVVQSIIPTTHCEQKLPAAVLPNNRTTPQIVRDE